MNPDDLTALRLLLDTDDPLPPLITASEALEWTGQFPSWTGADPRAVEAFVTGACRLWEQQVGARDVCPSNARFTALERARMTACRYTYVEAAEGLPGDHLEGSIVSPTSSK
ncbi:hypothetical protein AB0B15_43110 [Streptomyces sp. NPDC045456]|uniref:hypothetical protein n=1 Tax=Streptomyces sp. NPDC045456 TaxID=3155254 RepID=UPI0033F12AB7